MSKTKSPKQQPDRVIRKAPNPSGIKVTGHKSVGLTKKN